MDFLDFFSFPEICPPLELANNVEVIPKFPHYYSGERVFIKCLELGETFKAYCEEGAVEGSWKIPEYTCGTSTSGLQVRSDEIKSNNTIQCTYYTIQLQYNTTTVEQYNYNTIQYNTIPIAMLLIGLLIHHLMLMSLFFTQANFFTQIYVADK